jgi:hypothetical protein
MSSLILCDKSDTTVTTTKTAESLHVTNMKIEDRRPSFLNRSPLFLYILEPKGKATGSDKKQDVIDQISEAEALIEDDYIDHQATMTYQEDPTWVEFCEDLPLE